MRLRKIGALVVSVVALAALALLLVVRVWGDYPEAEPFWKGVIAVRRLAQGPDHPDVALALFRLGGLYLGKRRYSEAESVYKQALEIYESGQWRDHPMVSSVLSYLALLYREQARYGDAAEVAERALAMSEERFGRESVPAALSATALADLYVKQGRYSEAEAVYIRVLPNQLAVTVEDEGHENAIASAALNQLAILYMEEGRYEEAEPLAERALSIEEKRSGGREDVRLATHLSLLAAVYEEQGRDAEAETLYRRAVALGQKLERRAGDEVVAAAYDGLAGLLTTQGRYAEAEPLFEHSLAMREQTFGREHPWVAYSLNNMAGLYDKQGHYAEAERLYENATAIRERTLGREHPLVAATLDNLALSYLKQGRATEALAAVRQATVILEHRLGQPVLNTGTGRRAEKRGSSGAFKLHLKALAEAVVREPARDAKHAGEAFRVMQLARASATAQAVASMTARFASRDDALARLAREREDLVSRWRALEAQLVHAESAIGSERQFEAEMRLRRSIAGTLERLGELDAELGRRFPKYQALTIQKPLPLEQAQTLLRPNEALLSYLVGQYESYLTVLRMNKAQFFRLDFGQVELERRVQALRRYVESRQDFPAADAYGLYQKLFVPAESYLRGATQLIVVPDGALMSLPFALLVTQLPEDLPSTLEASLRLDSGVERDARGRVLQVVTSQPENEKLAWLAKRYAVTVLPAESSLGALRSIPKTRVAEAPFAGFGDPALNGGTDARGLKVAAFFARGSVADVKQVRHLQRLPETAVELRRIADALGGSPKTVFLAAEATEARVKDSDLARYRVLAFATHTLLAGDIKGLAEPALVLTPPAQASQFDDGLLTAGEIAQLNLDADWVLLSACSTAAPDGTPGAEGLSGLARAFFYAGARALLVSHWAVDSQATVALTTGMFGELAKNPKLEKAEALRRSMLALMNDETHPEYAHPMFWAPFELVGEGGPSR